MPTRMMSRAWLGMASILNTSLVRSCAAQAELTEHVMPALLLLTPGSLSHPTQP